MSAIGKIGRGPFEVRAARRDFKVEPMFVAEDFSGDLVKILRLSCGSLSSDCISQ